MAKRRYIVIMNRRYHTYSMFDTELGYSLKSGFPTRDKAQSEADRYEKWRKEEAELKLKEAEKV